MITIFVTDNIKQQIMNIKTFSATVIVMLILASKVQAQLTTGGDIAGGYLWTDSNINGNPQYHFEGSGKLWLGYKAENYDWRVTMKGGYKDQEGEKTTTDVSYADTLDANSNTTISHTRNKPMSIDTRYDLNWQQPDKSTYKFWAQYRYTDSQHSYFLFGVYHNLHKSDEGNFRVDMKEETGHHMTVGYSGTTMLNGRGWVLKSAANLSLTKRKVDDLWGIVHVDITNPEEPASISVREWNMHPDYTDWAMNASLQMADTVMSTSVSKLMLGGGIRFKSEHETYMHDAEVTGGINAEKSKVDCVEQHVTGTRYFLEPFVNGEWNSGRWSLRAEYGARLYHMTTSDKKGTGVAIYNLMDPSQPLSDNSISHFKTMVAGLADLTCKLSKHHSLTLTNKIGNRLPTHQESVLGFVQSVEYNKVILGNPNIKPEISNHYALSHTFSSPRFSAKTSVSAEFTHNQINTYLYDCTIDGWEERAQIALNVADVATFTVSESVTWQNKWLTTKAEVWGKLSNNRGTGPIFGGKTVDDSNWGWKLEAKAKLGHGWQVNTDFQHESGYKTIAMDMSPSWPSSSINLEKQFKQITLYVNTRNLIDPTFRLSINDTEGQSIYSLKSYMNNRIVMIGCRWTLQ